MLLLLVKTTRLKTRYLIDKPRHQAVLATAPQLLSRNPLMRHVMSAAWPWQGLLMNACVRAMERGALLYHKELAKGDMWEDVVSFVLPTDLLRLLPELRQLLRQGAGGAQVQDVLPGQRVIEEWVTHMGEQPGREKQVLD